MGGEGNSNCGNEKCIQKFWLENLKERDPGTPRRRWENNIGMDNRKIGFEGVEWLHVAQDRDRWRDFVKTVMSCRVP